MSDFPSLLPVFHRLFHWNSTRDLTKMHQNIQPFAERCDKKKTESRRISNDTTEMYCSTITPIFSVSVVNHWFLLVLMTSRQSSFAKKENGVGHSTYKKWSRPVSKWHKKIVLGSVLLQYFSYIVVTFSVESRWVEFLIHKDVLFPTYPCPEYMERRCERGEGMDLWSRLGGLGGNKEDMDL